MLNEATCVPSHQPVISLLNAIKPGHDVNVVRKIFAAIATDNGEVRKFNAVLKDLIF